MSSRCCNMAELGSLESCISVNQAARSRTMQSRRGSMLLLCLLIVACRPVEEVQPPWRGAATHTPHYRSLTFVQSTDAKLPPAVIDHVHEMAGSRGPRKPGKKPDKPDGRHNRPVNKNRCLDSAAAGGGVWTTFCGDIQDASIRKRCFEVGLESEQRRKGFCNNFFKVLTAWPVSLSPIGLNVALKLLDLSSPRGCSSSRGDHALSA